MNLDLATPNSIGKFQSEAISRSFGVRIKPRALKKKWGVFYTPSDVIAALCDWCIQLPSDTILEPSFGGCGFLYESVKRLTALGCPNAWNNLCGCDVDQRAFECLPDNLSNEGNRFIKKNFLDVDPSEFQISGFDAILGNPPYVSRHNMWDYQKESAQNIDRKNKVEISKRASLWVYFVIHAQSFLKNGGRMGWVLPRSLTQSFYGKQLLRQTSKHFSSVVVISISRRIFLDTGTSEATDILLCEGYKKEPEADCLIEYRNAETINEIDARPGVSSTPTPVGMRNLESSRANLLPEEIQSHYNKIALSSATLSKFSDIRIGIVTGATKFFILKRSMLAEAGLVRSDMDPILATFKLCEGLDWAHEDIAKNEHLNKRVLLVRSRSGRKSNRVRAYIEKFPWHLRETVKTFKKRNIWYAADDRLIPDAFFPCLINDFPWLVINTAKTNSNNNVHRVYFKKGISMKTQKLISISCVSTFGQLSAELSGDVCGSHGLKFDPSNCMNMRLLILGQVSGSVVDKIYGEIDKLLRDGKRGNVRNTADAFLRENLGDSIYGHQMIEKLSAGLSLLKSHRLGRIV